MISLTKVNRNSLLRENKFIAPTQMLYSTDDTEHVKDFYQSLVTHHMINDRPGLDRLLAVLNKKDNHGYSFLDHVYISKIRGKKWTGMAEAIISQMCVVGAKFTKEALNKKYKCEKNPKIFKYSPEYWADLSDDVDY